MQTERALKVRDSLVSRVRDVYSSARIFGAGHDELHESLARAMESPKGTPTWAREYARGYGAALSDSLYRESLVFGGWIRDDRPGAPLAFRFLSTHRGRPDYYEANGVEPSDYADSGRVSWRGHYWGDKTARPFFTLNDSDLFNCCTGGAAPDWTRFSRLYVGGCIDGDGETLGGVPDSDARFWTVYARLADSDLGECEAICDAPTRAVALYAARELSRRASLPIEESN